MRKWPKFYYLVVGMVLACACLFVSCQGLANADGDGSISIVGDNNRTSAYLYKEVKK